MLCIIPVRQPHNSLCCRRAGGSRTLHCPLAGASCLLVEVGMSNVRSLPPYVPFGGQASNFPFRKGHSERPGRILTGEWKAGAADRVETLTLQDCPSGVLLASPGCACTLTSPFTHSLTSASPTLPCPGSCVMVPGVLTGGTKALNKESHRWVMIDDGLLQLHGNTRPQGLCMVSGVFGNF